TGTRMPAEASPSRKVRSPPNVPRLTKILWPGKKAPWSSKKMGLLESDAVCAAATAGGVIMAAAARAGAWAGAGVGGNNKSVTVPGGKEGGDGSSGSGVGKARGGSGWPGTNGPNDSVPMTVSVGGATPPTKRTLP